MQFDHSPVGMLQWAATRIRPAYVASDQFKLVFEVARPDLVRFRRQRPAHGADHCADADAGQVGRAMPTCAPSIRTAAPTTWMASHSRPPAEAWATQNSGSIFGVQLNRRW
ncbi:hypothetical protein ACTMU2_37970 [Cupriavidus basilensis]